MSVSSLLLGLGLDLSLPPLAAVGAISFVCLFSLGLGPVTWVVMSEVLPKEARTGAGSIGVALNWSTAFLMVSRERARAGVECRPRFDGASYLVDPADFLTPVVDDSTRRYETQHPAPSTPR